MLFINHVSFIPSPLGVIALEMLSSIRSQASPSPSPSISD